MEREKEKERIKV